MRIVYLEDVRLGIGVADKLAGFLAGTSGARGAPGQTIPAVILFTSGSEGTPKGVVLSHRNMLANCAQCLARIDANGQDLVFNALPVFHSFGLTGGLIMPLRRRRADVPLSVAAALPDRAGADLRQRRHHHVRHRHVPRGLCARRAPLRFAQRAPDDCGRRGREG